MSDERPRAASGLLVSLRRLLATALELGQIRLELLGTELERQKLRILDALVWAAFGALLMGFGVVLIAGLLLVLFWDAYRLQLLTGLAVLFIACGVLMLRLARRKLQTPEGAFATSRAELAQDRALLAPREGEDGAYRRS